MTMKPITENKSGINAPFTKHTIELIIGTWKAWFGAEKTKLLIAEALNEWIAHEKKMELNGYLITDYSVYLIIKAPQANFHQLLSVFYERMTNAIERHYHSESVSSKLLYHKPFEKRNFFNDDLIKLMLGKTIGSAYFDLEQAYLISNIKHYKYCSAIDYTGAKGPVNVILLGEKE